MRTGVIYNRKCCCCLKYRSPSSVVGGYCATCREIIQRFWSQVCELAEDGRGENAAPIGPHCAAATEIIAEMRRQADSEEGR